MHTSHPATNLPPSLRGRLPDWRLTDILTLPYGQRMRHLRILRFIITPSRPVVAQDASSRHFI